MSAQPNRERARAAWGAKCPDWVLVLAGRCDGAGSQSSVARELGVSSSAVNQVLGCAYKGRLDRLELRVRGKYMKATVECPVLGPISTADCVGYQTRARTFKATNPLRRALRAACPNCPHREDACSSEKT